MSLGDLQAFIGQCLSNVDPTLDLSSGSPWDTKVVQPILRRLGTDPYTVDIGLFVQTLLNQQFPDIPTKEGDAFTDLLIKAAVLLWNPFVREVTRVANAQSFKDPTILTVEEAQALGANLFATLDQGSKARGTVRIYFAQPQNCNVSPVNFVTDKQGLHFFPTQIQSIGVTEMLMNVEGTLYYFDISIIAEAAGSQYNDPPDSVVTIANISSAVRITNKIRFTAGTPPQTAVQFIDQAEQSLTERSLVTQRGIVAQVTKAFPDVTRLNSIGFNDPAMERDIITGGGLGPVLGAGTLISAEPDGDNAALTRRITIDPSQGVDFFTLIGPTGSTADGFVLTGFGLFPALSVPTVRDMHVRAVVDAYTLDMVEQIMAPGAVGVGFTLRRSTLTLSGIPGGILFPNQPDGTVTLPDGQVHIGGCTDVYVSGAASDSAQLTIVDLFDDQPLLSGVALKLVSSTSVRLSDLKLGTNYAVGDAAYTALSNAATDGLSIQILDPPSAGGYRIMRVTQPIALGLSPVLTISPVLPVVVAGSFRWRLSSSIFMDLIEPKETRVSGSDLRTTLGSMTVSTIGGTDFANYGVSTNDVLRVTTGGLIVGDYVVEHVALPFFEQLTVDRPMAASVNGAKYSIFRPNPTGGLALPLIRVDTIDLLDTSSQPVGTTIPYAKPVSVTSNGFANSANGIKADLVDATMGIVFGMTGPLAVTGLTLDFSMPEALPAPLLFTVTFSGNAPATIAADINAASVAAGGPAVIAVVLPVTGSPIGIIPAVPNTQIVGGTAFAALFGVPFTLIFPTTRDITSATLELPGAGGWAALRPVLDSDFDVAQALDGNQIGFFHLGDNPGDPVPNSPYIFPSYDPLRTKVDFNPQVGVRVQVGSRSLGTARLFFLDPTSFQIDTSTIFTLTRADGSMLRYFADSTDNYQAVPALPSDTKPLDGISTALSSFFRSPSSDFLASGIQPSDLLIIDFIPVTGAAALPDPVPNMNGAVLLISLDESLTKTVTFIHDSSSIAPTDVTRAGVVKQINQQAGQTICALDGGNHVVFNPTVALTIFGSPASNSANIQLGFPLVTVVNVNNRALNAGTYTVLPNGVAPFGDVTQLVVVPALASSESSEQFRVLHAGVQRIVSTTMATQVGIAGLYYFDVTLVSEGTGNAYDTAPGLQLSVMGYKSDGYYLTTDDPNLTFSVVEKPKLHVSLSILPPGVSDSPANAVQLTGQNIQINYDRSTLTQNVSNFITSATERVINASPLARHLIPYFVRFDLSYFGGSATSVVTPDLTAYIEALNPIDSLEVGQLNEIVLARGATAVTNPITLVAVIHNIDRSISTEQSEDRLNTGVLAGFIPDVLTITRNIAG